MTAQSRVQQNVKNLLQAAHAKKRRGKKPILTPRLTAALDRTKMSSNSATLVIAKTDMSLGHDVLVLALNRWTVRHQRMLHRSQYAEHLKAKFQADYSMVVHWDGKLIPDLANKECIDRLPVIVSGKGASQLITVAKLPSGTGAAQAGAVFQALQDWSVRGMCFDTTSSNTGRISGTCILLEQKLQRGLLSLACRHHIMELILGAVFQVCLGATSSPEVLLFKRFKDHWQFIDRANYETSITNSDVSTSQEDVRNSLIEFAQKHIQEQQPRDDYREFLELTLLFLGVVPERGVHFIAMHHARWMSKVLYSLKIWMFKGQFRLTTKEERGLQELCIFIVRVYMRAWFTANLAAAAPYNDMLLLKSILSYSGINTAVSSAASYKFSNHPWYLSPELVGLTFFDDQVSAETKRRMVNSMNESGNEELEDIKLISVDLESFNNRRLEDFASPKSKRLFDMMELQTGFLDADPDEWTNHEDYRRSFETFGRFRLSTTMQRGV